MNRALTGAAIGVWLVCATAGSATINIETVPVGNLGNAADTTGYGAVDHSYNIGKYEVTAGQYTEFLNKVAGVDTYGLYSTFMWSDSYGCKIERTGLSGSYEYSVASDWANRPVNWVSWGDSARFANWLHNGQPTGAQNFSTTEDGSYTLNGAMDAEALMVVTRKPNATWVVPSEDEWYKAAYHKNDGVTGNYFDYPTSSDTTPGQDMADASGNNANYYTAPYAYPIDSGRVTTVAGEFQNSDSPYGTFDQGGNVWEWNEAILLYGSSRGLRGGSFASDGPSDPLRASARYDGVGPLHTHSDFGFRVARVPEPASMAILALGGLGMLVRRRGVQA